MRVVGWITTAIAMIAATAVLRGIVFSVLWGYWVVPLGVTDINLVEAIGLMGILGLVTYSPPNEEAKRKVEEKGSGVAFVEGMSTSVFITLFALGFGWFVHLFA